MRVHSSLLAALAAIQIATAGSPRLSAFEPNRPGDGDAFGSARLVEVPPIEVLMRIEVTSSDPEPAERKRPRVPRRMLP